MGRIDPGRKEALVFMPSIARNRNAKKICQCERERPREKER